MKKIYLSIFIQILSITLFAQTNINGVTSYSCPLSTNYSLAKRSAFVVDNNGNKWIGFSSGSGSSAVLARYNGVTWKSFAGVLPSPLKVYALAADTGRTVWVGTNNGLYSFYDTVLVSSNPGGTFLSLACGGGNLYAGTTSGLIVKNSTGSTTFTHVGNALTSDSILSIAYEGPNAIWLGNPKGLDKFDGASIFSFYNVQPAQKDSVLCIYIDGSNNKWLGTNHHGVIKYDNANFNTMAQLYGTPFGTFWPTKTNSIGKGPNGGIFFSSHHRTSTPSITACSMSGSIEITNGQIKNYAWIAYSTLTPTGTWNYPIIQYDAINNKMFYVNVDLTINPFLYSFDPTQYLFPLITSSNSDYLDINNVQALITANSDMGWDLEGTKYFVPKGSNSSPLRAASLWMGGFHNGSLREAAMTYRQNGVDFWPGPLDPATDSIDQATSAAYDQVWKVNRFDIANFIYHWNAGHVQNGTFTPPAAILTWPGDNVHPLAPFIDVNGDGIYDPMGAGDYPDIKGDQMIWWVFNDVVKHSETGAARLGVQVNASAYAFVCPTIADSNKVLNYTTFYNYKVINFSPDRVDSFYLSPWIDADLGNYQDDYIQCNVSNNYGFIYNGDNYDEDYNNSTGYHANLPVFSCNILRGPLADVNDGKDNNNDGTIDEANERCMMNTFTYYTNTGDQYTGNPRSNAPLDYYNFMNARWRNGVPMTYGGNGVNGGSTETCHHLFPGTSDPYGVSIGGSATFPHSPIGSYGACGWTQSQANIVKADMRFLIGVGPFTMDAGGTYELDYALVFSQDSVNMDTTCQHTYALADNLRVKRWFDNNSFPSCLSLSGVGIKENNIEPLNVSLYPNPATDQLLVEIKESSQQATIEILDIIGNVIKGATYMAPGKYQDLPVSDLSPGLYMIRVKTTAGETVKKFVKE